MSKVKIPTPLRKFTGHQSEVEAEGSTVIEIIESLDKNHPGIRKRLLDDNNEIRKFINIYVGDEDVRFLKGKQTKSEGKDITIVPAIAGG